MVIVTIPKQGDTFNGRIGRQGHDKQHGMNSFLFIVIFIVVVVVVVQVVVKLFVVRRLHLKQIEPLDRGISRQGHGK